MRPVPDLPIRLNAAPHSPNNLHEATDEQLDAVRQIYFIAARIRDRAANRRAGSPGPSAVEVGEVLKQISEISRASR